jgi:hypothetical protein
MFKSYAIIEKAVEDGVYKGYRRAYKNNDEPDEDDVQDYICIAVMDALDKVMKFKDEE